MTYSIKTYPSDGVTTDFNITFDYLDASHVIVSVDKVRTSAVGSNYKFEFNNATSIRVVTVIDELPVPAGKDIKIERETPIDTPAVLFGGGASLTSANLNKNSEYLTYALQEASDTNEAFTKLYLGSFDIAPTSDNEGEPLQIGAVYYDSIASALFYWTGTTWIIGESTAAAETFKLAAEAAATAAQIAQAGAETAEANAGTSESNAEAARVASVAALSGAEVAETNAASIAAASSSSAVNAAASEANAAASSAQALAQADAAVVSASSASTSASSASTSASNASTSASNASTSASNASNSASNASTSASNAAASETNASTSQTASAASAGAAALSAASAATTAEALIGLDLEAIAASKAVTAVDVFVYDTSKDSDGGAWRKRTQGTSWYNEALNTATRGSRREFPAVAVIVAEAGKVTIYDGDDPALPMWMVFIGNTIYMLWAINGASIAMTHGLLVTGQTTDVWTADFLKDAGKEISNSGQKDFLGSIADRNSSAGRSSVFVGPSIVNRTINDVAMTVLPNAPIDAATGLRVPTIAVATDGGVSVIKDDGTVVDSGSTLAFGYVVFDGENNIWAGRNVANHTMMFSTQADYEAGDGFGDVVAETASATMWEFPLLVRSEESDFGNNILSIGGRSATGHAVPGLMLHQPNYIDQSKGMSALLTSTYNTGWMLGDIKGAFLSDTDDTDLVGSGELVTNGTFDSDISGWSNPTDGRSTASFASGKLRITNDTSGFGYAYQTITTVVGKRYVIQWEPSAVGTTYATRVFLGTSEGTSNVAGSTAAAVTGQQQLTFVATSTTTFCGVQVFTSSVGPTIQMDFDNISVKLADADRSVNNNGLVISGNITRTPVATGADLVAYSGFSASNYLEQPYNSDLDFGTGDFSIMGWVNGAKANNDVLLERREAAYTGNRIYVGLLTTSVFRAILGTATQFDSSAVVPANVWTHFALVRNAGTLYWYVNGQVSASTANSTDVSNATAVLKVGSAANGTTAADQSSLALLRISATAPTASQIAKIYEDEKYLFQENAQATLYGSSDAVTALAYDDSTELLHVGTSAGRSDFQGLRRVDNTTTAVGAAISASNSLVVEE